MTIISSEIFSLLNLLLPGFITSYIIYSLTSFPKKSEFESIILALIYTLLIKAIISIIQIIAIFVGRIIIIGYWNSTSDLILGFIFAVSLGLIISYLLNNDTLHAFLRDKQITKQTSYPSEWYGTFSENLTYVILHLKDGRRIMGWPTEWPSFPTEGHFVLERADWLLEENGNSKIVPIINVEKIMIDAKSVEIVEFSIKTIGGKTNEQEGTPTDSKTDS